MEALGEEIVRQAAHLHAGTARLLAVLADFDRGRGWEAGGHSSCAHWLSVNTGFDLRTARGYVRVARALEELPATRSAMNHGRLAYSQVRALTRVATPETEDDLLALAEGCTTETLERRVRAWRTAGRREAADEPDPARGSREPPSPRAAHREASRRRADGGATSLENTLLLCRRHHRLVHEEGWTVEWWGKGRPCFTDPRGGRWQRERDIPRELELRALEVALVAAEGAEAAAPAAPP